MKPEPRNDKRTSGAWLALGALVTLGSLLALPLVVMGMPESVRIPIVSEHDDDEAPALFSHWEHDQYKCFVCHESIFPQEKLGFTHGDMDQGRYCGACHDGKTAWDIDDEDVECETCHVERK